MRLENHFPQLETTKNPVYATGNIKKLKIEEKFLPNFFLILFNELSAKSYSAKNPKESSKLAKHFVSRKN